MSDRAATFERLDAIQARGLERLRAAGPDRALLVELLEAACLLELAKIETARVDPVSYLQHAIDVVAQMYPIHGVAATVSIEGRGTIEVVCGELPRAGLSYPLVGEGVIFGVIVAGETKVDLGSSEHFFCDVALRIGTGLASVVHSERLRRELAIETAGRVASQLAEDDIVERLEELALALASFPGVVGAELAIDHVAVGPPLRLRAGFWDDDGRPHRVDVVVLDSGAAGRLTARVRASDETHGAAPAVEAVMQHLAASLDWVTMTHALREQAETEPLTGLGNRRRLQRALDQQLVRAQRYRERVAVLLLDLDGFKAVNDELGHETGDAVIVACAQALRECTHAYDEVVRLGGDEFVVVAPIPDALDARRRAEEMRVHIARRCNALLPSDWGLTAAIGVAVFPEAAIDPESLLRAADTALYRAKDSGPDGVVLAEPAVADITAQRAKPRRHPTHPGSVS